MTPNETPNEAKDVAEKLLEQLESNEYELSAGIRTLSPAKVRQVCARLLELEELATELEKEIDDCEASYKMVLCDWETEQNERIEIQAELKAANERCGKLDDCLKYIIQRGYTGAEFVARECLASLRSLQVENE